MDPAVILHGLEYGSFGTGLIVQSKRSDTCLTLKHSGNTIDFLACTRDGWKSWGYRLANHAYASTIYWRTLRPLDAVRQDGDSGNVRGDSVVEDGLAVCTLIDACCMQRQRS
jgi:hypothetical protein